MAGRLTAAEKARRADIVAQLVERHRNAQQWITRGVAGELAILMDLLDPNDLDGSFAKWFKIVLEVVAKYRRLSADEAANFYQEFRTTLGITAAYTPVVVTKVDEAALAASLHSVTVAQIKKGTALRQPIAKLMENALINAVGVAGRHAQDGGRETIIETGKRDGKATGWARSASATACSFCGMLSGRGAVYFSSDTAGFHPHDHCHCVAVPVFDRSDNHPGTSDAWRERYQQFVDAFQASKDAGNKTYMNSKVEFRYWLDHGRIADRKKP